MCERTIPVCTLPWIGIQWTVLATERWHEDLRLRSYCVCVCVFGGGGKSVCEYICVGVCVNKK